MSKPKPILFSTAMVQAILEGRKTQTRRVVKPQPDIVFQLRDNITVIYSCISEIGHGRIDIKTNTDISQRRLYGWERWQDLLKDEIQRLWSQGLRGLVSVKRACDEERVFNCLIVPSEQEGYKECTQTDMHGISRATGKGDSAGQAFGQQQSEQYPIQSLLGHTGGELDGPEAGRSGKRRGKTSHEQANRRGTGAYKVGCKNGDIITKAHCADIGDVTIRYSQDMRWRKGMILWVRETWAVTCGGKYEYKADGGLPPRVIHESANESGGKDVVTERWFPSIHMPYVASRLFLRITDIRVERLQDITEEDCLKEGIESVKVSEATYHSGSYREWFRELWQSINGPESWEANPWVWVVSFERTEKPE